MENSSAVAYCQWHDANPCDAVALNWIVHGPAGQARWQDDFIARRFPYAPATPDHHVKTLCRTAMFTASMPHYPRTWRDQPYVFHASNGEPHVAMDAATGPALSASPTAEFAWISHYFFRSSEEFLVKWSRNRGGHATIKSPTNTVLRPEFVRIFMERYAADAQPKPEVERCCPGFDAELARLMAVPGVASAWANIKQLHAERIRRILPMFVDAPGIRAAGVHGQAFMATLGLAPTTP